MSSPACRAVSRGALPLVVALAVSLGACGASSQKGPARPKSADGEISYDRSRCDSKTHRVVRLTTRLDEVPDIWKFYATVMEADTKIDVLVCKQIDLNHDGKVDFVTYYDDKGRVAKEELDLNYDGTFEEVAIYELGKIVRKEYDRNLDGRPDSWAYYEDEKLTRIERDTLFQGRVNCWEYYLDGHLERIGWDTTGAGTVDRWDRAPDTGDEAAEEGPVTPAAPPAVAPSSKR